MSAPRKRFPDSTQGAKKQQQSSSDAAYRVVGNGGLSDRFWLAVISACVLLFVAVDINYHTFPVPARGADSSSPSLAAGQKSSDGSLRQNYGENAVGFVEQNAREFLDIVCQFGTRHLGSHANEVLTVEAFEKQINLIQKAANPVHKIEVDMQMPTGCFNLAFIGNFTTCYANVRNILVRLSPSSTSTKAALLVNCHYDTAVSSPGKY